MKQKTLAENLVDLPKWAQSEIKVLQMRLREAKSEIDRVLENPESNTVLGTTFVTRDEKTRYLKNNQEVTFILTKGEVSARIKNDSVEISAQSLSNNSDMCIRPHVSNVITVHLKP